MADPVKDYLAAIGRRGGEANTAAQNAARAANGRKGGRPPKEKTEWRGKMKIANEITKHGTSTKRRGEQLMAAKKKHWYVKEIGRRERVLVFGLRAARDAYVAERVEEGCTRRAITRAEAMSDGSLPARKDWIHLSSWQEEDLIANTSREPRGSAPGAA